MATNNIVNSDMLAKFFKRDIRTIQMWAKHEGMPREARDQFDFIKCVSWRLDFLEKKIQETRQQKAQDLLASKNAEFKDILIKEKQQQLLDKTETFNKIAELLNLIVNTIDGIGIKIAPFIIGKKDPIEVAEIIDKEINFIKEKIATSKLEYDLQEES